MHSSALQLRITGSVGTDGALVPAEDPYKSSIRETGLAVGTDRNASHWVQERLLRRPPWPRRGWPQGDLRVQLPLGAYVGSVVFASLFLTAATTLGRYAGDGLPVNVPLLAGLLAGAVALERTRTELFG